jgi:hypothetical protein
MQVSKWGNSLAVRPCWCDPSPNPLPQGEGSMVLGLSGFGYTMSQRTIIAWSSCTTLWQCIT